MRGPDEEGERVREDEHDAVSANEDAERDTCERGDGKGAVSAEDCGVEGNENGNGGH